MTYIYIYIYIYLYLAVLYGMGESQVPYQGSNPCSLHWKCILTTGPPGKSLTLTYIIFKMSFEKSGRSKCLGPTATP